MSRLRYKVTDEAALFLAYESQLRLLEGRSQTTVATYVVRVRAFLHYMAVTHPSVELADVNRVQIRGWVLHEANRGNCGHYAPRPSCSRSAASFGS